MRLLHPVGAVFAAAAIAGGAALGSAPDDPAASPSATAARNAVAARPNRSPIVGTWQIVEWWTADPKSGDRRYPLGRQPLGYHVYDTSGHVFVQLSRSPSERLGEDRWRGLDVDDLRKLLDRYECYFGTYDIDPGRGIIAEHVDDDVRREHAGTAREIPFRMDGDRLILGDGRSWQRVLMRAY